MRASATSWKYCLDTSTLLWQWRGFLHEFQQWWTDRSCRGTFLNWNIFVLAKSCWYERTWVEVGRLQQTSDNSHWKTSASIIPSDIWCQSWQSSSLQGLRRCQKPNLGTEPLGGTGSTLNGNHPDVLVPRFSSILEHPNHNSPFPTCLIWVMEKPVISADVWRGSCQSPRNGADNFLLGSGHFDGTWKWALTPPLTANVNV